MNLISIRVGSVKGANGHRGSASELDKLKQSIENVGLLQPIVTNSKHEIISGRRRLAAITIIGWTHIPAIVCENLDDIRKAIRAERDENTCRLDLTPTQIKAYADQLREIEKPKAKERQESGRPSGKLPEGTGEVNEIAATGAGTSRKTLEKIDEVVESGEQDVIEEMDRTGKVDPAHKEVKKRQIEKSDDPLASAANEFCKQLNQYAKTLDQWQSDFKEMKSNPLGHHVHWETVSSQLTAVRKAIHQGRPKRMCPYCKATGKKGKEDCKSCKGTGHVCESIYRSGCAAVGVPVEAEGDE